MDTRFKKDDFVVYGKNGICLIEDIRSLNFLGEAGEYYVLKPKYNKTSTLYVPLAKDELVSKMRCVISKEEIDNMLSCAHEQKMDWIENKGERTEMFNSVISGGDSQKLFKLVMCIYLKKQEKGKEGKKLSTMDDSILKTAERLIEEEFAFALKCSADKAIDYIKKKIGA